MTSLGPVPPAQTSALTSLPGPNQSSTSSSNDQESFPLAAQIPLQSFSLPSFPPEASRLRELTLTSDIKLDEYQSLVESTTTSTSTPDLPKSITHLTLELFSLGFPSGWLTALGNALPNIKSLTLFSCLVDGLTDETRSDAEVFFTGLVERGLKEVHLIDTFARPGFFGSVGEGLEKESGKGGAEDGVKVVNVSFTYRGHEDEGFLGRVNGEELAGLVGKGLVGFGARFLPESQSVDEVQNGEEKEKEKVAEGVLPFAGDSRATLALKRRIELGSGNGVLRGVKVLDLSMWTLSATEVGEVLYTCAAGGEAELQALTVSVLMEAGWWEKLMEGCKYNGVGNALQVLEVVGVPGGLGGGLLGSEDGMKNIGEVCPSLERFEMSILRSTTAGVVRLGKKGEGNWEMES